MKNLGGQVAGSTLTADDWNQLAGEVETVILSTSQALDGSQPAQLSKAMMDYVARSGFLLDLGLGSGDAIILEANTNLILPTTIPSDGMRIRWRPFAANTGVTTVIIRPFGAHSGTAVKTEAGAALVGGELSTSVDAEARFDTGADFWRLIGA